MANSSHDKQLSKLVRIGYKLVALIAVAAVAATIYWTEKQPEYPPHFSVHETAPEFGPRPPHAFIDALRDIINTGEIDDNFLANWEDVIRYPLHIDVWQGTEYLGETMSFGVSPGNSLIDLYDNYRTLSGREEDAIPDDAMLIVTFFFKPVMYDELSARPAIGLKKFLKPNTDGAYFQCNDTFVLMPNFRWAHHGLRDGWAAGHKYLEWVGCDDDQLMADIGKVASFTTLELVQFVKGQETERWSGGDRIVPQDIVNNTTMEQYISSQQEWFKQHLTDQGALPYIYNTLYDNYQPDNQLIRQWYGTIALGLINQQFPTTENREAFLRNVAFNMETYYKEDEGKGYFELKSRSFLATNAIAAQALNIANKLTDEYQEEHQALVKMIEYQLVDNQFDTIIHPRVQKGNDIDFAAMASLVAWLELIESKESERTAESLIPIFEHYYDLWSDDKSLYGAPHHLSAYGALYRALKSPPENLKLAIYAIADELLACQSVADSTPPHEKGAFSKADCESASDRPISSSVRAEGLLEAYRVAVAEKDIARSDRYKHAIKLALRHLLQGQIDLNNIFYFKHHDRSMGGMRYSLADPYIRIDGPGHSVMAVYKILKYINLDD